MAADALEKSALEAKDKEQLTAIAEALGVKAGARATKAVLVEKILEKTGAAAQPAGSDKPDPRAENADDAPREKSDRSNGRGDRGDRGERPARDNDEPKVYLGADGEPLAEWEVELAKHEGRIDELTVAGEGGGQSRGDRGDRGERGDRRGVVGGEGAVDGIDRDGFAHPWAVVFRDLLASAVAARAVICAAVASDVAFSLSAAAAGVKRAAASKRWPMPPR